MADWKDKLPEAAQTYLQGRHLDEIECIVSDLPGIARGKAMPAAKFAKQSQSFSYPSRSFIKPSPAVGAKRPAMTALPNPT